MVHPPINILYRHFEAVLMLGITALANDGKAVLLQHEGRKMPSHQNVYIIHNDPDIEQQTPCMVQAEAGGIHNRPMYESSH